MGSLFPNSIDSFTDPLANSPLNSPSHAGQHQNLNDAVEKIETYMGLVKVIPTSATGGTVGVTGTVTIGNAVPSVTVNGVFTSLYNGYLVTVHGGTASTADENVPLQLTSSGTPSATGYYGTAIYALWGSTLITQSANNATNMLYAGGLDSRVILQLQIFNPALATSTTMFGPFIRQALAGQTSYIHRVNTAYDGFRIAPGLGTLTGGSICVYGYRN